MQYDIEKLEKDIKKKVTDGFGQGYGADYKPWLSKKTSSTGFKHYIPGIKSKRQHLLLSKLEAHYF